jgi:hypothetical protein
MAKYLVYKNVTIGGMMKFPADGAVVHVIPTKSFKFDVKFHFAVELSGAGKGVRKAGLEDFG